MASPLLQLEAIEKSFAGVRALKPLSLTLEAGEVLGLIGENGAGKSTLIRILSGVQTSDAGRILWQGAPVRFSSPHDALQAGVATIHQELAGFGHLSVAENMLMGEPWPRHRWGGVHWPELHREATARLTRFDLDIPSHRFFHQLNAAEKQEVAIARALSRHSRLLILDEPTASLSEPDVNRLFAQLRRLRQEGVAILYVSHRLDEILKLTDRVAILRDGELVATCPTVDTSLGRMVKDMVGRPLDQVYPRTRHQELSGSPALRHQEAHSAKSETLKPKPEIEQSLLTRILRAFQETAATRSRRREEADEAWADERPPPHLGGYDDQEKSGLNTAISVDPSTPMLELHDLRREGMFQAISFQLHAGEIVGLAGLVGAGRSELGRAIYGLCPIDSGMMRLRDKPWMPAGPHEAVAAGVVYLPEERKRQGLVPEHSVQHSISIGFSDLLTRWGVIPSRKEKDRVQHAMQSCDVRAASPAQEIGTLSGGNQQKAILARWLERDPEVILLNEPTRGVDVGAKAEIHALIDRLAGRGKAILLISSDLPELIGMSDRVLVMHRGSNSAELSGPALTQENVILAASGLFHSSPSE